MKEFAVGHLDLKMMPEKNKLCNLSCTKVYDLQVLLIGRLHLPPFGIGSGLYFIGF